MHSKGGKVVKIAGVVAEYNPFHNGHRYQAQKMRENGVTHTVAVMSGNFVQRGDFAIMSKWQRAQAAVENGIDLVIELPSPYALMSAQGFAESATYILSALGCVDELYFGCECGDVDAIKRIASAMLTREYEDTLIDEISDGSSYPVACEKSIQKMLGEQYKDELKFPNNLLAVEYVKSLIRLGSEIDPHGIERVGAAHDSDDKNDQFMSASAIRQSLKDQGVEAIRGYAPCTTADLFSACASLGKSPCDFARLERAVLAKLRTLSADDLREIPDVSEGLENRIIDTVKVSSTLNELIENIKTKRYTHSRIRRIIIRAFLGLTSQFSALPPPYARILALNERGREIIKEAKKSASIPIITKSAHILRLDDEFARMVFEKEIEMTDIFALSSPVPQPCSMELTENLYIG